MSYSYNPAQNAPPQPIVDDTFIRAQVDRIVENAHPVKVILFGSHARGIAREDSDIDLFIIMESKLPWWKRSKAVDDVLGNYGWMFDLIIYTPEEFNETKHVLGMIPYIAEHEGKILYERR